MKNKYTNEEYLTKKLKEELAKNTHPVWLYIDGLIKILPYTNKPQN